MGGCRFDGDLVAATVVELFVVDQRTIDFGGLPKGQQAEPDLDVLTVVHSGLMYRRESAGFGKDLSWDSLPSKRCLSGCGAHGMVFDEVERSKSRLPDNAAPSHNQVPRRPEPQPPNFSRSAPPTTPASTSKCGPPSAPFLPLVPDSELSHGYPSHEPPPAFIAVPTPPMPRKISSTKTNGSARSD